MSDFGTIYLVEDSPSLGRLYQTYLAGAGYEVELFTSGEDVLDACRRRMPQLIVLDLGLPGIDGMEVLTRMRESSLRCGSVVITADGSVSAAVEAMRLGALDFLEKPFNAERLRTTVGHAMERCQLRKVAQALEGGTRHEQFSSFIGGSLSMQVVYRIIDSAATSKATVFVTGESGTGKELCAQAIHERSGRKDGPFIALNCAAIPKELFESEIFGHVKGAFSGAVAERRGAAERANGGTLFLDEIGEMDLDLQVKLRRFIQTGTFTRVGGSAVQSTDIRFVCATNRDPLEEVANGRFREDLYYRLNVVPIRLPPLRDRDDDVLMVAERFLRSFAVEEHKDFLGFDAEVQGIFRRFDWPGNVRQLQNVVKNIVVLNNGETVERDMLPEPLRSIGSTVSVPASGKPPVSAVPPADDSPNGVIEPLWITERRAIEAAVSRCGDNIPVAAALLGVSASTIYRKKKTWEADGSQVPEAIGVEAMS
ncbi:MAG: sigma-54 dependent transcriptional regulator [Pseudomonadota bacterium]|nr:sigma-54 dependent transcriptional regulator [Pseudomonadota bacterium]